MLSRLSSMVAVRRRGRPRRCANGKPTDPQIAHIAYTAGVLDVEASNRLAISKNADVRAFAEQMMKDHTAVNDQALALVKNTEHAGGQRHEQGLDRAGSGEARRAGQTLSGARAD